MKTFIASCITLVLTVCCVIFLSGIPVAAGQNMLNEINLMYESKKSPDALEASLQKITELWDNSKKAVSLTVGHTEIGLIDAALAELDAAAKLNDDTEYMLSLAGLRVVLSELIASEKFSFGRIF